MVAIDGETKKRSECDYVSMGVAVTGEELELGALGLLTFRRGRFLPFSYIW